MIRQHVRFHYAALRKSPHFVAFMILAAAITFQSLYPLRELCGDLNLRVSWAFFPLLLSSDFSRMFQFTVLILFSAVPFICDISPFLWCRSTRGKSFAGTALYIFSASALYLLFLQLLSFVFMTPYVYFGASWGKILYNAAYGMLSYEYNVFALKYALSAMSLATPFHLMGLSWGIAFLQFSLIGWLMLTASLIWPRRKGLPMVAGLVYVFSPDIITAFGVSEHNLYFPAAWQKLNSLSLRTSVQNNHFAPWQAALILGGMILVCMAVSRSSFKRLEPFAERV